MKKLFCLIVLAVLATANSAADDAWAGLTANQEDYVKLSFQLKKKTNQKNVLITQKANAITASREAQEAIYNPQIVTVNSEIAALEAQIAALGT